MTGKTQLLDLIKSLIFDLDGTLYINDDLGREINLSACRYLADIKGISLAEAMALMKKTRADLAISAGAEATLSHACLALGGDIVEMHRRFAAEINAEAFLTRDDRVVDLLSYLASKAELHIYTNNNRSLSTRIMDTLGISGLFLKVFTIEDTWRPKPDRQTLTSIFHQIGRKPEECLFVGDRYDVDLRLPVEMGCAVFPVKCIEDLLQLRLGTRQ